MENEVCNLKHDTIDKYFESTDRILISHEERLDKLETAQAETNVRMDNVCNRLDKLIDALYDVFKPAIGAIVVMGLGFIIWYIQKL